MVEGVGYRCLMWVGGRERRERARETGRDSSAVMVERGRREGRKKRPLMKL